MGGREGTGEEVCEVPKERWRANARVYDENSKQLSPGKTLEVY